MKIITLNVTPKPKMRMVRSDKFLIGANELRMGKARLARKRSLEAYWNYKKELEWLAKEYGFKIGTPLSIHFYLPMPESWSAKKRAEMNGKSHESTPDLDNMIKAVKDCLTEQDSAVHTYGEMKKIWAVEGRIDFLISDDYQPLKPVVIPFKKTKSKQPELF